MASTGRARRPTAAARILEKTAGSDGAVKRARGRPRKAGDEATAAERRRTQIRVAQRAYRNRKETAIATLEKRVQESNAANEAIVRAFLGLHNFLAARSGLLEEHTDLAQQLRRTTDTILALAQKGDAEDGDNSKSTDSILGGSPQSSQPPIATASPASDTVPDAVPSTASMDPAAVSLMLWNSLVDEVQPSPSTGPSASTSDGDHCSHCGNPLPSQTTTFSLPDGDCGSLAPSQPAVPATDAVTNNDALALFSPTFCTASLPLDASFFAPLDGTSVDFVQAPSASATADLLSGVMADGSSTATTTATSYGTLASSYPPFSDLALPYLSLATSFGLRLRRRAIERGLQLLTSPNPPPARLQRAFGCSARFESLDSIRARLYREFVSPSPSRQPGGAGGAAATSTNVPRWDQTVTHVQPRRWQRSFGKIDGEVRESDRGPPGFEGPFYDCEEIELYLRQRGVDIPPGSESVVVVVGDDDFPVETADETKNHQPVVNWSLAGSSPRASLCDRNSLWTLDVERFVFELTFRGTCLGTSPGFRREDVHEAFWKAVYRDA